MCDFLEVHRDGKRVLLRLSGSTRIDNLREVSALFQQRKISGREFVRYLHNTFADDSGMDWIEAPRELFHLANLLSPRNKVDGR